MFVWCREKQDSHPDKHFKSASRASVKQMLLLLLVISLRRAAADNICSLKVITQFQFQLFKMKQSLWNISLKQLQSAAAMCGAPLVSLSWNPAGEPFRLFALIGFFFSRVEERDLNLEFVLVMPI